VEAAPIARRRPPRRRRRRSWAWLALLLYLGFAAAAVVLVGRALQGGLPSFGGDSREAGATGTLSGGPDELALRTIGTRAQRSTLGVGGGTGFVAWQTPGLTLVMTARPAGGWKLTDGRGIAVSYNGRTWAGTLVRADGASGLGLVRLAASGLGVALWGDPGRPAVRNGQLVAVVGRRSARTVSIAQAGKRRLYPDSSGLGDFAGAPVLDAQSQLVGVVDSGGGIVPIARACGPIRRC